MRAILIFLCCLMSPVAVAQSQTSRSGPVDLHARYALGVNVNLPDGWEAAFEYEMRMVDNASAYRGSYLTSELGYELTDWLSLFSNLPARQCDERALPPLCNGGSTFP
jgi:hypothetical protein